MGAVLSYLMGRQDPNFSSWYASNVDVCKNNIADIVKEFTAGEK